MKWNAMPNVGSRAIHTCTHLNFDRICVLNAKRMRIFISNEWCERIRNGNKRRIMEIASNWKIGKHMYYHLVCYSIRRSVLNLSLSLLFFRWLLSFRSLSLRSHIFHLTLPFCSSFECLKEINFVCRWLWSVSLFRMHFFKISIVLCEHAEWEKKINVKGKK